MQCLIQRKQLTVQLSKTDLDCCFLMTEVDGQADILLVINLVSAI